MYKPYNNPNLKDLRQAWHNWLVEQEWQQPMFSTIVTNCHTLPNFPQKTEDRISKSDEYLNRLDMRVSKGLLGRKYNQTQNKDRRHSGFLFREHENTNLHYHGIIDIKEFDKGLYESEMKKQWSKILPSGSIVLRPVDSMFVDVRYVLKDQSGPKLSGGNSFFQFPNVLKK